MAEGTSTLPFPECSVCKEPYTSNVVPKCIPACGHTCCLTCLLRLAEITANGEIQCPECRSKTTLGVGGVNAFKTNIEVQRIADQLRACQQTGPLPPRATATSAPLNVPPRPLLLPPPPRSLPPQPLPLPSKNDVFVAVENNCPALIRQVSSSANGRDFLRSLKADDSTGDNLLHRAIRRGRTEIVKHLVSGDFASYSGILDGKNKMGDAAIHLAAARDYCDIVRALGNAGANLNLIGACGDNFQTLGLIIGSKVAEDYRRECANGLMGQTALHAACMFGHESTVAVLLELGAEINARSNQQNVSIHGAAQSGRVPVARLLLQHGANVNIKGLNGGTPLQVAASFGHREMVEFLLEHGANVNATREDGSTALHVAADTRHLDTLQLLQDWNGNMGARNDAGLTPAHYLWERYIVS